MGGHRLDRAPIASYGPEKGIAEDHVIVGPECSIGIVPVEPGKYRITTDMVEGAEENFMRVVLRRQ